MMDQLTISVKLVLLLLLQVLASVDALSTSPATPSFPVISTTTTNTNLPFSFASHLANKQITVDDTTIITSDKIILTYLEINGWLLTMNNGMMVLIDPILEGPLDFFGMPMLFQGTKRVLPTTGLMELLPLQHIDCLLLTQGLDDHAHIPTLTKLRQSKHFPKDVPIVAPPSAQSALKQSGWYGSTSNIRFLDHGQETRILNQRCNVDDDDTVTTSLSIQATTGALVGPPWQRRENGYILSCAKRPSSNSTTATTTTSTTTTTNTATTQPPMISLYIEPHVEFHPPELSKYAPVDVVITPTTGQALPMLELVHGPKDSIRLIKTLRPRFVVPMPNGEIDIAGLVAQFVTTVGTPKDFERGMALRKNNLTIPTLVSVEPGQDIVLEL
jgi:hypothetical protein